MHPQPHLIPAGVQMARSTERINEQERENFVLGNLSGRMKTQKKRGAAAMKQPEPERGEDAALISAAAGMMPAVTLAGIDERLVLSDMDERLSVNRIGFGAFQIMLLAICGLNFCADAISIVLVSYLSPILLQTWSLSPEAAASIMAAVFGGEFFGALCWGIVADHFGRRLGFLVSTSLTIAGGILTAFLPHGSYWLLLVLQFAVGFGVGGLAIPFDLFLEFLPRSKRGTWLLVYQFFWPLGSIFSVAAAWALLTSPTTSVLGLPSVSSWRVFCVVCTLPLVVSVCFGVCLLPESTKWLRMKKKHEEAQDVLVWAAAFNQRWGRSVGNTSGRKSAMSESVMSERTASVYSPASSSPTSVNYGSAAASPLPLPLNMPLILSGFQDDELAPSVASPVSTKMLQEKMLSSAGGGSNSSKKISGVKLQAKLESDLPLLSSLLELVKEPLRRTTILLWVWWFCFGFIYYGCISVFATVFHIDDDKHSESSANGSNATSAPPQFDFTVEMVGAACEMLGIGLVIFLMDRIGRVESQSAMFILSGCSSAGLACTLWLSPTWRQTEVYFAVAALAVVTRLTALGANSATWVITPEAYPTAVRATGHSVATMANRVGAVLSPFFVQSDLPIFTVVASYGVLSLLAGTLGFGCAARFAPNYVHRIASTR